MSELTEEEFNAALQKRVQEMPTKIELTLEEVWSLWSYLEEFDLDERTKVVIAPCPPEGINEDHCHYVVYLPDFPEEGVYPLGPFYTEESES